VRLILVLSLIFLFAPLLSEARGQSSTSGSATEVKDVAAGKQLLGRHKFQLHWISWNEWKDFADLSVVNRNGVYSIKARQAKGGDYVEIDGKVLSVEEKEFTFSGKIVTRVSYKNEGKPCERDGVMTFKITGKRKYWRLQEMQSPCDETTDYVDIFLR
jgi:hypothetical protein